ncbi:uromodulin-like [Kryptolebias marmoratus]|uniref:uromodulin-like n=1 Tax=Kryptolebias marmoratus TaxID=37003 RepID=UPI0018ACE19E|nr:uromodulin-like [Kryptolebias marmoratus]
MHGLCQNSSSDAKLPNCSYMSCEAPYDDPDEDLICPNNTKSCDHLKEAPFTSCPINRQPYIDACTYTLSIYPAVDGLKCQFLQAYAKACRLYSNITLDSWRSKTKCHPDEAFCYNRTCLDREFCAEKSSCGETACFCRAHVACDLQNNYPHAVCKKNYASLTLYNCLLAEQDIDYTVLHLNHPECRGELNQMDNTVTFSFKGDTCGTEIMDNDTHVIYKNTIMNQNITEEITRHKMVKIDISCYQTQPDIVTKTFTVIDSPYYGIVVPGPWNYTLFIKAYIDDSCTKPVNSNTQIRLNEKVWVKLSTQWLDEDVVALVTDDCWATDHPSPTAEPRHDLIKNGCPADSTVMIRGNGMATFNSFGFNMFGFNGGSDQLYLHCQVRLCVKTSNNNCVPMCGRKRRRRSARSEYDSPALISMGWTS